MKKNALVFAALFFALLSANALADYDSTAIHDRGTQHLIGRMNVSGGLSAARIYTPRNYSSASYAGIATIDRIMFGDGTNSESYEAFKLDKNTDTNKTDKLNVCKISIKKEMPTDGSGPALERPPNKSCTAIKSSIQSIVGTYTIESPAPTVPANCVIDFYTDCQSEALAAFSAIDQSANAQQYSAVETHELFTNALGLLAQCGTKTKGMLAPYGDGAGIMYCDGTRWIALQGVAYDSAAPAAMDSTADALSALQDTIDALSSRVDALEAAAAAAGSGSGSGTSGTSGDGGTTGG